MFNWIKRIFCKKIKSSLVISPNGRKYGWRKDPSYPKVLKYTAVDPNTLPASVDLVPGMPPVYDQGDLGSCSAQSVCAAVEFDQKKQGFSDVYVPSRLYVYYYERYDQGDTADDTGSTISESIKAVNDYGCPHEDLWPYDVNKFGVKPSSRAILDAAKHKALQHSAVPQDDKQIKAQLASGFPVCFGIMVFESFEGPEPAKTGIIPMPDLGNEQQLGGHAILLCGYDDAKQLFKFRNSWGNSWGDKGYGYLPYQYVLDPNMASDFWVVTEVS